VLHPDGLGRGSWRRPGGPVAAKPDDLVTAERIRPLPQQLTGVEVVDMIVPASILMPTCRWSQGDAAYHHGPTCRRR
jgi:hypothetical protein